MSIRGTAPYSKKREWLLIVAADAVLLSLVSFFTSVVLLGFNLGSEEMAESIAACSSLAIAITGATYLVASLRTPASKDSTTKGSM